jgi:hypothetical protein
MFLDWGSFVTPSQNMTVVSNSYIFNGMLPALRNAHPGHPQGLHFGTSGNGAIYGTA